MDKQKTDSGHTVNSETRNSEQYTENRTEPDRGFDRDEQKIFMEIIDGKNFSFWIYLGAVGSDLLRRLPRIL